MIKLDLFLECYNGFSLKNKSMWMSGIKRFRNKILVNISITTEKLLGKSSTIHNFKKEPLKILAIIEMSYD